ncbi:hypothetical protein RM572_00535 [Streptomyces sp. DSM 42041]|uniref:DUF317 domain-containing protein n=1 Tax=Streptomyces hazeniae TaxID=3075538 RepID=A0ABU2NJW2_9ACTN|nr:hypothetical protein [Streptomyces sp. DSM 42041]MDT0377262.1 hypothetical protein [Streptomyces sp. DSM 42041]
MAALPRAIPAHALTALTDTLAAHGAHLGPRKAGTRLTHTVQHDGTTWELTYLGPLGGDPAWRLAGPGCQHGLLTDAHEAADHITRNTATKEPRP